MSNKMKNNNNNKEKNTAQNEKQKAQPNASFDRFAKPEDTSKTLRRLGVYLSGNRWRLILGLLLSSLGAVGGVAGNAFLQPIINTFVYERSFSAAIRQLF